MVVGIIGAGASGMAAALSAAQNPDVQVLLLERQSRVGRKLQATGNGRCNLTNLNTHQSHYHGQTPAFCKDALEQFDVTKTLSWFANLGLYTVAEPSGKVYPYSDQANSVVDVLRFALNQPNILLHLGFEVEKIKVLPSGFQISSPEETITCDKLIIACGGLAGSKLGGTMAGYKLLGRLGHKATKLRPALVQIQSDWKALASLKGIRANCHVRILHNGQVFAESTGELQFTELGLSGPVMFEISRDVCHASGDWVAQLDFLPQWDGQTLLQALRGSRRKNLPAEELLTGILHNRLGRVLTRAAGVKGSGLCEDLTDGDLQAVCRCVKAFDVHLTEPLGMDSAQVTAGGVITEQFNSVTMESKQIPGLYACGEVLDIDGDCGGYNLQWAWSSGYVAGLHAGKEKHDTNSGNCVTP